MRHILCYGDSNTWGYIPGAGKRYDEHVRWTGVLADELGDGYCIHEDGMNARTTVCDSPYKPFLNGLKMLPGVLWAQKPLDLVIISLGTNDLKNHTANQAAQGVGELVAYAKNMDRLYQSSTPVFRHVPRILVVSPIAVGDDLPNVDPDDELAGAHAESLKFPEKIAAVCRDWDVEMLDAQTIVEPSPIDCVHMSPEGHAALGRAIAAKVREMLSDVD